MVQGVARVLEFEPFVDGKYKETKAREEQRAPKKPLRADDSAQVVF